MLFAAAILAFDGVAVIVLGVLAHRPLFMVMGGVMSVAAVLTLWSWNRYHAHLAGIRRDADNLREELRSLDKFIERR